MREHIVIAIRTNVVLLVVVSGVYPALVWAIGQLAFRDQANGSLIVRDGRVIGSSLIGQELTSDRYFHSRPQGVSNLGPTSRKLYERISKDVGGRTNVPADAVTTSGSGVDPHISPANALQQAARVARARGVGEAAIRALVRQHIDGRFLGIYGQPRVNVLLLNLALDDMMHAHVARE